MESTKPAYRHRERVRWVDTDASGRIHFTAMLRWFEWAEQEFFRALGFSLTDLRGENVNIPRVHVEADYSAALCYDDEVEIEVHVERVGNASATLAYRVLKRDGVVAGQGRVTFCSIDLETETARPIPQALRSALRAAQPGPPTV